MPETNERLVVASWKPDGGKRWPFVLASLSEGYATRLVDRERPFRDGAKLDDTGAKAVGWEVEALFFNGVTEPDAGLPDSLWPDYAYDFRRNALRRHMPGTLTLPSEGPLRVRVASYSRVENFAEREGARITIQWRDDNEDDTTASSFQLPSAKAVARTLAGRSVSELERSGAGGDLVSQINTYAAALEDALNAPSDLAENMQARAGALVSAVRRVEDAFSRANADATQEVSRLLLDPTSSLAWRSLTLLSDVAASAPSLAEVVPPRRVVFPRVVSLFAVATDARVDVARVLPLNRHVVDPSRVPARVPIFLPGSA